MRNYTHFWSTKHPLDATGWERITRSARRIMAICDDYAAAMISNSNRQKYVKIDSIAPQTYSLFQLTPEPVSFAYCRTNHDVFDLPVTAMLLRAKCEYPAWIKLTSDGLWDDWLPARELCAEVFRYTESDYAEAKRDFDELIEVKEDRGAR